MAMRFHLPYPPSGWDLYQGWGKTRSLSSSYKKWRDDCRFFIKRQDVTISIPFSISIALQRQSKRHDIDNRTKAVLDALQYYGVIRNDNLCERLSITWAAGLPADCVVLLDVCEEALAA